MVSTTVFNGPLISFKHFRLISPLECEGTSTTHMRNNIFLRYVSPLSSFLHSDFVSFISVVCLFVYTKYLNKMSLVDQLFHVLVNQKPLDELGWTATISSVSYSSIPFILYSDG